MISNTVTAFRISRTSPSLLTGKHLGPFALWTAFPSALAGRDACDYYEPSVTLGLAPRRPSRIPLCAGRVEHDVGVPSVPLNRLIARRSPAGRVRTTKLGIVRYR